MNLDNFIPAARGYPEFFSYAFLRRESGENVKGYRWEAPLAGTITNYLLLSIILRKEYEVYRAHDGQEAIEKFEGCRPDMILMDIKMPVMDGLEATRRIRLKGGTLPIIALTANAYDSDRDKAFEAGCDDYMAKPIMAPALREMIKKYFGE